MDERQDHDRVRAYLDRIGIDDIPAPDAEALTRLHEAHLRTVPFENLDIHLGEPIVLDEDALVRKVVDRHRGGFCFELNGAFGWLLGALGYDVDLVAARVWAGDRLTPPFAHAALVVVDGGVRHLVDVGFGALSLHPLRLDDRAEQIDPSGVFRLVDVPDGDVEVLQDGKPVYRLEPRPRSLSDFAHANWYQQTSPDSHFTQSLTCSRVLDDGRITISANKLIVRGPAGRTETELSDVDVLAAYRERFGIELDRVPRVRSPR